MARDATRVPDVRAFLTGGKPVAGRSGRVRAKGHRGQTDRSFAGLTVDSRHITSHHITSHPITSHPITSRCVTSRHLTSRPVTSPPVTSRHPASPRLAARPFRQWTRDGSSSARYVDGLKRPFHRQLPIFAFQSTHGE